VSRPRLGRRALIALGVTAILGGAAAGAAGAGSGPLLPSADPFYSYGGTLAGVAPGAVLRTRTVSQVALGITAPVRATQLLYRTTGELGQPTVTVATVIRPPLSVGAAKIVSYQTAYDALGSKCDPSYTLQGGNPGYQTAAAEETIITAYVAAGYTVVVPDYEGVALDWAAGQESGYGTLDGIRAAESELKLAPASTPVGLIGYSGGAIATDFAAELAPAYAAGLEIVGVAEGGVPVDVAHNLAYVNGSPDWSGVIPAVIVSLSRAFNIDLTPYLSPYGADLANKVKDQCISDFLGSYPGLTIQKLLKPRYANFLGVPVFARVVNRLIMSHTGTPKGPLFIGVGDSDGTGDGVMLHHDDEALAHAYCQRGVSVQFTVYQGATHTGAAVPFELGAFAFLTARLNGQAVPNGCAAIAAGNSLAPLNVATAPTPRLRLRLIGPRARRHGYVIALSTTTGTLRTLVITLRDGGRVLERARLGRVSSLGRQLVLRDHGRVPPAGRYSVTVTQRGRTLIHRAFRLRH
jgi:hypothetical protein